MKCDSRRTSAGVKFSSSALFGISGWICAAKREASPRYSRCASCGTWSVMAAARRLRPILADDPQDGGHPAQRRDAEQRVAQQLERRVAAAAAVMQAAKITQA